MKKEQSLVEKLMKSIDSLEYDERRKLFKLLKQEYDLCDWNDMFASEKRDLLENDDFLFDEIRGDVLGNLDDDDLKRIAEQYEERLMLVIPSVSGYTLADVFEREYGVIFKYLHARYPALELETRLRDNGIIQKYDIIC